MSKGPKKVKLHDFIEGIGANKVAAHIGVDPATVSYWKTYRSAPRPEHAHKLIEFARGTLSWESIYKPFVDAKLLESVPSYK